MDDPCLNKFFRLLPKKHPQQLLLGVRRLKAFCLMVLSHEIQNNAFVVLAQRTLGLVNNDRRPHCWR